MGLSRRRVKLGCVALVMLVAGVGTGCGSSSTSSSDGEAKATTTTKAPPTQAELDGALLTFNDLPGWAPMTDADPDDDRWCPDASAALTEILSGGGNPTGFVEFWKGVFGPFVSEQVTVVDDAEASFMAAQRALDSCTSGSWTETDPANDMTIKHSMKATSIPTHGYDQAAYELAWASDNFTAEGYLVVIRIDGALMLIDGMTTPYATDPFGVEQFTAIVDTAFGKFAALSGEATSGSATTQPAISKADLIEQVDTICTGVGDEMRAALPADPTNVDQVTRYFRRYVEVNRAAIDKAEALGPPDTDVQAWETLIADMHAAVNAVEANLDQVVRWIVANDTAAYLASEVGQAQQRFADESKAFGLKVCGTPIGQTSSA